QHRRKPRGPRYFCWFWHCQPDRNRCWANQHWITAHRGRSLHVESPTAHRCVEVQLESLTSVSSGTRAVRFKLKGRYLSNLRLFKSMFSIPLGSLLPKPGKPPPVPPPICSWSFCSSSMEGIPPPGIPPPRPGIPGICGMPPPRFVFFGFLRLPFLPLRPFGFFLVAERAPPPIPNCPAILVIIFFASLKRS